MRPPDDGHDKRAWRQSARAARRHIDTDAWTEDLIRVLRDWPPLRRAGTVAGFLPLPDEPDLSGPIAVDDRWVVPRVDPDGGPLRFHRPTGALVRHRLGMEEPPPSAACIPWDRIDLILVPGVAFDRRGVRLGRGGGHYDRTLPLLRPDALRVGVAHPDVLVDALPEDRHDQRMDALALPTGVDLLR
ncbi:MAG: 5-formyltetrahydrofolate cyclo-ligase [Trueperaceae bacterium]